MRTDDWINTLASGLEPVPPGVPARRLTTALATGAALSVLLVLVGFGMRPDFGAALLAPVMWLKLGFPALLAASAAVAVWRLAVPGRRPGWVRWAWLPLMLAMLALGGWVLQRAAVAERNALWMGQTWDVCTFNIAAVALPVLLGLVLALRSLAPTRLRWAGGMAGLLAGATGTLAYALHCPEMSLPFIALWNTLAMLLMGALGLVLGPRMLRW